ncbi:MAG: hypothetical protein K0S21_854 [Rhizobiaceae bacterium]|jgi:hypothetical protein|nr:hypothetical protein [Rhizobiaceae bacterium]
MRRCSREALPHAPADKRSAAQGTRPGRLTWDGTAAFPSRRLFARHLSVLAPWRREAEAEHGSSPPMAKCDHSGRSPAGGPPGGKLTLSGGTRSVFSTLRQRAIGPESRFDLRLDRMQDDKRRRSGALRPAHGAAATFPRGIRHGHDRSHTDGLPDLRPLTLPFGTPSFRNAWITAAMHVPGAAPDSEMVRGTPEVQGGPLAMRFPRKGTAYLTPHSAFWPFHGESS